MDTLKKRENSYALWFIALFVFSIFRSGQAEIRIRETNRNYQQGDWITYSTTRFIRNISIGERFVYFATTGGITRYNFFSNKWDFPWTVSNGLADDDISLVAKDLNTGFLWCTHELGISYLEPASQLWFNFFYDEMGFGYNDYVTSIGFGNDRQVYLVTAANKWMVSDNTTANFHTISRPTNDDYIKWYGAKEKNNAKLPYMFMSGGFLFDERSKFIDDLNLRHFKITCWVQDPWQNLWIGTWGLGAGHGDLTTTRLELLQYGLWDEAVDAIKQDGQALWIGGVQGQSEPAGITEWIVPDQKPNYYEPYLLTGFDNDQVSSIAVDGETVWFGTHDGLTRYDRRKRIWRTYTVVNHLQNNWVNDVIVDDDAIWVATAMGVSMIPKAGVGTDSMHIHSIMRPSLATVEVYDLDEQENLLWMATEYGIFVYDKDKKTGGFYKGAVGPADQPTFAVSVYGDEVWFGTAEGVAGLNSKLREWLKPPARLYKTNTEINRILASKDAIWAATQNGVLKYDKLRERWVHFTMLDGLPSNEVYSLLLDGDYIWFGSARGLTRFYWNSPYRVD